MNRTSLIYITFACLHGVGVFVVPQLISVDGSASFLRRNWGYHFLTYFPIPVVGLAYVLFIASLTPAIQSLFVSTLSRISVAVKGKRKSLVYLAISTLALAVLWGLRQKYPFLGDGYVRSSELDRGIVHGSAGLFIRLLLQTSTTFDLSGIETYRIVSTLLGVPFVFLSLCVAYEIGTDTLSRVASAMLIGFSGILQFYAGYIETYALLPILMLLSVWLGLRGERHAILRYAALATSFFAYFVHPLCGILAPSALYLIWVHDVRRRGRLFSSLFLAILVLGIAVGFTRGFFDSAVAAILPLIPDQDRTYALLTATNLWERLNGIILCCPAAIPLLLVLKRQERMTASSSRSGFLWILSAAGLVSVFTFDFVLGSQDWDLMALVSFPVCLISAHYLSRLHTPKPATVVLPTIAICLIHTIPWILVNHTDASIDRAEDTVVNEPTDYHRTHLPSIRIASFLKIAGHVDRAIIVLERGLERHPNNYQLNQNLSAYQAAIGEYKEAIKYSEAALQIEPAYVHAFRALIFSLREAGLTDDADEYLRDHPVRLARMGTEEYRKGDLGRAALYWAGSILTDLRDTEALFEEPKADEILVRAYLATPNAKSPVPFSELPLQTRILARRAHRQGRLDHAVKLWQAAIRMGAEEADIYLSLGTVHYEMGDPERTEEVWREGLSKHDNQPFIAYNLGLLFYVQDRNTEAEVMFRRAIASRPDSAFFYRDYGRLLEKQGRTSDARKIYMQGLQLSPGDPDLLSASGRLGK
jgi:tetratricopeptide (TPR) repeat protein